MRTANRQPGLFLVFVFLLVALSACKSAAKPLIAEEQARLDRIVTDRDFTMIAQWAEPTPDASINAM
ncbi:MAG: hypothetical protein WBM56_02820, partial [Robiginitalea sp.]